MMDQDFLWPHLRDLPYFRATLRAVEARLMHEVDLKPPTLDLGSGDGHFASVVFDRPLDVGIDTAAAIMHEARQRHGHRLLVVADGAQLPHPDEYFASAISNSVLEHIPDVQAVLAEAGRVLRPGAPFYFCVPSDNFAPFLSIGRALDACRLGSPAKAYRRFFNRISRHHHCDDAETWRARLERAGLTLDHWWTYFSSGALAALEWGHYLGLPSLVAKKLAGRWVLWPSRTNLWLTDRLLRRYYDESLPKAGAYLFFVTHKPLTDKPVESEAANRP